MISKLLDEPYWDELDQRLDKTFNNFSKNGYLALYSFNGSLDTRSLVRVLTDAETTYQPGYQDVSQPLGIFTKDELKKLINLKNIHKSILDITMLTYAVSKRPGLLPELSKINDIEIFALALYYSQIYRTPSLSSIFNRIYSKELRDEPEEKRVLVKEKILQNIIFILMEKREMSFEDLIEILKKSLKEVFS